MRADMRPRSRRMSCRTSCFRSSAQGRGDRNRYCTIQIMAFRFFAAVTFLQRKEPFSRSSSKVDGHLAERVLFWIESISTCNKVGG